MHPFIAATTWAQTAPGRYTGRFDEAWYQGRGAFGGVIAGLVIRMSCNEIDPGRSPRTLHLHFCAPANAGPTELQIERVRSSKYLDHCFARLLQEDQVVAFATLTFAANRPSPMAYHDAVMPDAPAPETVASMPTMALAPTFTRFFDYRYCVGGLPFADGTTAELGGWIRPKEPLTLDFALAASHLDAWPPAAYARSASPLLLASADFTIHFLEPLPATDDFCLVHVRSSWAQDGYTEELRTLWSREGRLLAKCQQFIAIRKV